MEQQRSAEENQDGSIHSTPEQELLVPSPHSEYFLDILHLGGSLLREDYCTEAWYDDFSERVELVRDHLRPVMEFHYDLIDILNNAPPGALTRTQQDLKLDSMKKLTSLKKIRKELKRISETGYSCLCGEQDRFDFM